MVALGCAHAHPMWTVRLVCALSLHCTIRHLLAAAERANIHSSAGIYVPLQPHLIASTCCYTTERNGRRPPISVGREKCASQANVASCYVHLLWLFRYVQLRFHERCPSASVSPAERCRRELHIAVIVMTTLHIIYFGMVLGDKLLHSVVMLGIVQIPISISAAILVTRMWIYT